MALFVVSSVFSGLEDYSLSFTNAMDPDLIALPEKGKSFLVSKDQFSRLEVIEDIEAHVPVVEERVVFTFNNKQVVAVIKAVDSTYTDVTDINTAISAGNWLMPHTNQAVVGNLLAESLSMGMYSNDNLLEVLAMKPGEGMISTPDEAYNKIPLYTSGIYSLGNIETDAKYIFTDIHVGQSLLNWESNRYSSLEFRLKETAQEQKVIKELQSIFGDQLMYKNRAQINESLFKMLKTESLAIYLIFTLVIIVTLFCLTGSLIMIILEKQPHLKTLSDLGLSIRSIKNIFLFQGLILAIGGAIFGLILGLFITYIQQHYPIIYISDNLPYPVRIKQYNIIVVLSTLFILGFFASLLASSRINKKFLHQ